MTHGHGEYKRSSMDPWKFMDDQHKVDRDTCLSDLVCKGIL